LLSLLNGSPESRSEPSAESVQDPPVTALAQHDEHFRVLTEMV